MDLSPKARLMRDWLLTEWTEKLSGILESMADARPVVERRGASGGVDQPSDDALFWSQCFAISPEPIVWLAIPKSTSHEIGRRTLLAAGVDSVEEADCLNTFLEILAQSLSALGQAIGGHLAQEASATQGEQLQGPNANCEWVPVRVSFPDMQLESCWLAASPKFLDQLAAGGRLTQEKTAAPTVAAPAQAEQEVTLGENNSKTFDLLLDVSLPVSVSFGRTFLPIKEVLKLTTGSIVELDRAVNEPVDVIVNNCVIARGEVVVVEGNYGVRIQQIASRYDRLRTGSSSPEAQQILANGGRP